MRYYLLFIDIAIFFLNIVLIRYRIEFELLISSHLYFLLKFFQYSMFVVFEATFYRSPRINAFMNALLLLLVVFTV